MHPILFEIPFTNLTVKSYGLMMVIGFLSAVFLIRRLSRNITPDPQMITNAALYSLIAGVVGARLFYVIHYFEKFRTDLLAVFSIWEGGLELLGGVILSIAVIVAYMYYHKLAIRKYLDILAIGLMLALMFGRIGCFLNGCCFGRPTNLPWGVRFPYGSYAYRSQVFPNPQRNRAEPQLKLPDEFFFNNVRGNNLQYQRLKEYEELTDEQKKMVETGPYRCLPVHPTQLYSSANGALLCLVLYLFWRRSQNAIRSGKYEKLFTKPGCTFGLMFVLYGITRFFLEFVRDDNPLEFDGLTVSQNICIIMIIFGAALMTIFTQMKPDNAPVRKTKRRSLQALS
jgi:phosphatidylglycerol:prolipoprotein diacylglycerol transferase